jgi:CheY-like chemotaxis protein
MTHTLLLADDSVTIRRVIELTFTDENVRVLSVSTGREAIAGIESSRPDIVLADAGLSDVSGYDIAAFVKGRADLRHIPVILLAGAFEPLDEARARRSGSDGVLVKPFEPQMAVASVRQLLAGVAERREAARQAQRPPVVMPPRSNVIETSRTAFVDEMEPETVHTDPLFDASLDRLDDAFNSSGAPALEASVATDFANDLRELRSGRIDSGGFERQEFGDWDLPSRPSGEVVAPRAPEPVAPMPVYAAPPAPPVRFDPPPPAPVPNYGPAYVQQMSPPPAHAAPAPAPPVYVEPLPPPVSLPHRAEPAPPPLADAFSSLLAAEEGRPFLQAGFGSGPQPGGPLSADQMDQIVDRLIDRLGPDVRIAVIDLAERLVKAEIDRLKALR